MSDEFDLGPLLADGQSIDEERLSQDELDNLLYLAREAMEHPENLTIHQVQEMACGIIVSLRHIEVRPALLS